MTRISSRKSVDADFWRGRLEAARAYKESAENAFTLAAPGADANPTISQIVLATIRYVPKSDDPGLVWPGLWTQHSGSQKAIAD